MRVYQSSHLQKKYGGISKLNLFNLKIIAMKKYLFIITILAALVFVACDKPNDLIRNEADPTNLGSRPVSTNPLRDIDLAAKPTLDARSYPAGSTVRTELQFFSESPVKEIAVFQTISAVTTQVSTIPYAPAFSKYKGTDTLIVPYVIPAGASGANIKIDYIIRNVNTLSLTRTATIKRA